MTTAEPGTVTPIGLAALARRARQEMALFDHPPKEWVHPRLGPAGETVRDVVVVGAGQSGLGIAAALLRERITNIEVLDRNGAGQEGPWVTYARMLTLRTLKHLTGPDIGVPSLTFRAWHEAQHGRDAWDGLVRIPNGEWMRYLVWLRRTLDLPVRNGVRLLRAEPLRAGAPGLLALHLDTPDGPETRLARKLVLANGIDGAGGKRVPGWVWDALPRDRWAHTADAIDFAALRGQRVAVVGAGASAFDNAATALEAGASQVDVFIRRAALPQVNAFRVLETRGFFRSFGDAPDAQRWRFMQRLLSLPMPPPQDTLDRTLRHPNVRLHLGAPVLDGEATGAGLRLRTPQGWHGADFLILGTGFSVDLRLRPELEALASHAATWADHYAPPPDLADPAAGRYPYLGPGFELLPRDPATCDPAIAAALRNVHLFNVGSVVSMGPVAGGLNGMPFGLPRLLEHLSRDLFMPELDRAYAEFASYDEADPWEAVRAGE